MVRDVEAAFERATQAAGRLDRRLVIAGRSVLLRFAGPALMGPLLGALSYAVDSAPSAPDLTIHLFDNESTGSTFDPGVAAKERTDRSSEAGAQWLIAAGRRKAVFHGVSGVLSVLDDEARFAYWWIRSASSVDWFEQAAPLRTVFHWWLRTRDVQLLHAAAVETPGGGVLLAGKGGSGKSTSALACTVLGGLGYIADDYCLLEDGAGLTVHGLFTSAKVPTTTAARFPALVRELAPARRLDAPKTIWFMETHPGVRVSSGCAARVVVFPRVSGREGVRFVPLSAGQAFAALAPSTIFQLPGATRDDARRISGAMRRIPAFVAEIGPDLAAIPGALVRLVDEVTRTRPAHDA